MNLPTKSDQTRPDSSSPTASIVVPCRNEANWIAELLDAIAEQDRQPDEVVVVDDGSIDDTVMRITAWQARHRGLQLRVVAGGGRGAGAAMNTGITACQSDIIIRLDGHCRPASDYVRRALQTLIETGAGNVGGVWEIEPSAPTLVARVIAAAVAHPLGSGGVSYRHAIGSAIERVDTVPFGCFRRALWQELRGFDERLIGNQDYDFNYRIRLAGHDVLLNRAIRCVYRPRSTMIALARQYQRYGYWKRQMLRKFPGSLRGRQVLPIVVVPWVVLTAGLAAMIPSAALLAAVYPAVVLCAAFQIGVRLKSPAGAVVAAAVFPLVHLSWSTGFWRAVLAPPPESSGGDRASDSRL